VVRAVLAASRLTEAAVAETVAPAAQAERLAVAVAAVAVLRLVCHEMLQAPRLVCQPTAVAQAVLAVRVVTLAQPDQLQIQLSPKTTVAQHKRAPKQRASQPSPSTSGPRNRRPAQAGLATVAQHNRVLKSYWVAAGPYIDPSATQ
jgi:hypothetical protein